MTVCPVCGHEHAAGAKFCSECGAALKTEPPREERKVVTVLFADLVGFTSRAEQLDPEDVRAVLAPYWERLRGELEKRGGTVEKFIGDAVMALFGAPVAHEDDPERAVRAALAIRDWAREEADVQVRIAVNTGEALVLLSARPAEGQGMAAGDVVNTTARLQAAAPVNGVLVGETTYRATRHVIDYVEREPVVAKGKSDPVHVWEAVQARSRLGVDVESRPVLPLVGRTRELSVILDAFERAKAQREPQLVTLVGVPGIGKSRLVGEFFGRLEQQPDLVRWRQGRTLPYGDGVSLWALAEMVKAQAGIEENDSAVVATEKLRASVDALVDDEAERAWVLGHLLPLVGGEPTAGDSMPAWRRYFEGMAEQRPLVLVFEDMHWADDGLLDFVDHLVEWAVEVPLLALATSRPELLDRRPGWAGGKLNTSTIALTPLSDEESAQIIHGVLEQSVLPADVQQALLDRAGGNPLYAEQFALLYRERGTAEELPLPESVQGLIAARLDGLPAEEKRVVQDASVFGKVFWRGAVEAGDETLHGLERKGLVRRERRSAVGGETQYAFRHVLVRDVAYGQIPRAARGGKHVRAAAWIEGLGRADDHAELVAHHLASAHELGAVDDDRLRIALRRGGDRALALGSAAVAEGYLAEALRLWPDDDERPLVVADHARARFRATSDPSALIPALDTLERATMWDDAAELAAFAANAFWFMGRLPEAEKVLERGRAIADASAGPRARAAVLAESARMATFQERYDEAAEDSAEALELATKHGLAELRAALLVTTAVLRLTGDEFDESRALLEEAAVAAPRGSGQVIRALSNRAVIEQLAGETDAWRAWHAAAVDAATRAGDRPNLLWLEAPGIQYALWEGRWDEALRRADAFLASGRHYADRAALLCKAEILASRGEATAGLEYRDRALRRLDDNDDAQVVVPTLLVAAWVSFVAGDAAAGSRLIDDVLPLAQRSRPGHNAGSVCAIVRAGRQAPWLERLARSADTKRIRAARLMLEGRSREAAELWAGVTPYDEALARLEAARELAAAGRRVDADVELQRGLAFFRAVGATKVVRDHEALLGAAAAAE